MYLSRLTLRNFRRFGDGDHELDIALSSGVTALVGRNDCGKSAVIDAIRYALLTRDQNYIRIQPEDFHIDGSGKQAGDIFIRCHLGELDDEEKGAFAEYLSYDGSNVNVGGQVAVGLLQKLEGQVELGFRDLLAEIEIGSRRHPTLLRR